MFLQLGETKTGSFASDPDVNTKKKQLTIVSNIREITESIAEEMQVVKTDIEFSRAHFAKNQTMMKTLVRC